MEPMESRGQAMIRVALAQLKNDPGSMSTGKPGTYLRRESSTVRAKPVQQVLDGKQNGESKSKKVNFADPVVTQRFTYRRTLRELRAESGDGSSCSQPSGSPKAKLRPDSFGPRNEDSEDELVTTQSSERDVKKVERVTTRAAVKLKRALETSQQTDADGDAIMFKSKEQIASTSLTDPDSGDLFSAPKKAKIMPLFEDPPTHEYDGRIPKHGKLSLQKHLPAQENQPVQEGQPMVQVQPINVSEPLQENQTEHVSESLYGGQLALDGQSVHVNESTPSNQSESKYPPKSSQLQDREPVGSQETPRNNDRPRVLRKTTPKRGGPLQSMIHLPGRSGSMKISEDDGSTVQDCNNNETLKKNDDHSELISFRKVQLNDTNNEITTDENVVDGKFSEEDPKRAGYFAWFSILLAQHMSSVFKSIKISV